FKLLRDFERQMKLGLDPVFEPEKIGVRNADFWDQRVARLKAGDAVPEGCTECRPPGLRPGGGSPAAGARRRETGAGTRYERMTRSGTMASRASSHSQRCPGGRHSRTLSRPLAPGPRGTPAPEVSRHPATRVSPRSGRERTVSKRQSIRLRPALGQ